jgi:rare lipoprotein A (peptidoglycan hydrolase)
MKSPHHERGVPARRRGALAALTIASVAGPAIVPADAQAQVPAPMKVAARHHVLTGSRVPIHGTTTAPAGTRVVIEATHGHGWSTVARTKARQGGRFGTSFRPNSVGRYKLRARALVPGVDPTDTTKVTAYRPAAASWYGPGFYGRHLACGGSYGAGRIGVANKTLPCGTKVTLRYHGRMVVAPVIDRGPYSGNRVYDLTAATKRRLGFGSTGTVWSSR